MHNDLGIVYARAGEVEKAIKSFQRALQIKKDPVTYFSMAEPYIQLQDYDRAIEFLRMAISIREDYAEAYYNLAGIYASRGENDRVAENISRFIYYSQKQEQPLQEIEEKITAFSDHFGFDINVRKEYR